MAKSAEPGRSTASRLFAVLSAFERASGALTLTELSRRAGLPIATTYRLTRELVESGAVERNGHGEFQIGIRLWELGSLAPRQRDLRRVARPTMLQLHEATGDAVQLLVVNGRRALCIEKISGSRSVANLTEVGGNLPLHATSAGKVIMAFSEALDEIAPDRQLARYTRFTMTDPRHIAAEVIRVRGDLVAVSRDQMTVGTSSTAAPIFDSDLQFVGALSLLVPSSSNIDRAAAAVQERAQQISQRLGFRTPVLV